MFDLDGTLVDSGAAIVHAAGEAFARVGVAAPARAAVLSLVGLPLAEMLARLSPRPLAPLELDAVHDVYRATYIARAAHHEQLFAGVHDLLAALATSGVRLSVATGKSQKGADNATERLGIRPYFRSVLGFDAVPRGKPHPDLLLASLVELRVDARHALMVGDTTFDLQMARSAGVPAIGVTWGSHDAEMLAGERPLRLVDSMRELAAALGV